MLTIIHGDDIVSSRNYFVSLKKEGSLTFDAESLSLIELSQSLQGKELFGSSESIFIDNLFMRKGIKNLNGIIEVIKEKNVAQIYIWSDKILSAKQLSSFPKADLKLFKVPQNIWAFLDGIRPMTPGNVSSFHRAAETNEPEIIFALIIRQFRLMLGLADHSDNNIDEIKRLAPWQRSKLTKQASLFGLEKLKKTYKKLYKIDKAQKTGSSNLNLVQAIDILLLEI